MDEPRKPHDPTQLGPVAEGQLELNRELAQRSPEASREQVFREQEDLQRARPEAVGEAAARRSAAQEFAHEGRTAPVPPLEDADPGARAPFADAAATTRDPRGEAG
jgi:hypothetical protein